MATCSYCNTFFWFGGVGDGKRKFCNKECQHKGALLDLIDQLPEDVVRDHVERMHKGLCPQCGGSGPVDVHKSYRAWSIIIMTSWSSRPQIGCRSCARKSQLGNTAFTLIFGWWGFPWGLIMTPVQILRNIGGMIGGPDASKPSPLFEKIVKLDLAQQIVDQQQHPEPNLN